MSVAPWRGRPLSQLRSTESHMFRVLMTSVFAILLCLRCGGSIAAPASFSAFLDELWPEAKAFGVSRATFDSAFKGVEPDLSLPDLVLPGRTESSSKGQAEFTRPPQDYLDRKYLANLVEPGARIRQGAFERTRRRRERTGRRPQHRAGDLGQGNRIRFTQVAPLRDPRTRHAGLHRTAQGPVPAGIAVRPQDARRQDHNRAGDARIVGGSDGSHPIHAIRVLQVRLRPRSRRQGGPVQVGARRARLRREAA